MSSLPPFDVPFAGYLLAFALSAAVCFLGLGRVRRIEQPDVRRGLAALLLASGGWAASHVGYLAAPTWRLQYAFFVVGHSTSPEGTGFGLPTVKAVAEAHEWRVRAVEGTDGGARFEITGVEFTG